MIFTTLSSTTRTVSSLAPAKAMQRSKTATDLGALAQAAGAAILTAPVGKRRFNMQHPYAKRNNSHPKSRSIVTSTTSQSILVMDRRATRLASLARIARAQVMEPSGAHHPSATRRTAARPSHPQTKGKPISYKTMDSRRSQRRHRSSPHSRTAREARSSLSNHSGKWEGYTAYRLRHPSINRPMTQKTTPTAASAAIAKCQSRQRQGHSSGGTTQAAPRGAGRYPTFKTCQLSTP